MLRQHSQLMITLLVIADALAVTAAWLGSYWLRFALLPVDPAKGVPELSDKFLPMLPLVVLGHLIIFHRLKLYRPRRSESLWRELRDIIKAFVVAVVVVVLIDYAMPETNKISRQFTGTYAVFGTGCFAFFRLGVRAFLRTLRRRGWNRRQAAIIGTGRAAQRFHEALNRNRWTGFEVAYFVDDAEHRESDTLRGLPLRGPLAALGEIVDKHPVDSFFVALPTHDVQRVNEVLAALDTSSADVRLIPDVSPTYTLRPEVTQLDGMPVLSLRQTPLYGWNALVKRAFDLIVGSLCLLVALLPMAVIALLIKRSSPGPVLFRQRRVGLDGREFTMVKFRTMRVDAEAGGPRWTPDTAGLTPIGRFLRRTSLDELPNLFNVLSGHMSLVGPRPERPEFIREFRHEIPRYMLRHKTKAGMTGWAQIRGYRGNTSLRKRIQHDLYYIRNWSLALDMRILLATLTRAWFSSHEDPPSKGDEEASVIKKRAEDDVIAPSAPSPLPGEVARGRDSLVRDV